MEFFSETGLRPSFTGWTLVAPAVSVGNVAQLSCDLLLLNAKATRVGFLQHESVLDCVGNDPLGDGTGAALALEVYSLANKRIAFIQQRGLVVLGKQRAFATALAAWASESGFAKLVLLSGIEATMAQRAEQIGEGIYRYISTAEGGSDEAAEKLGWCLLEDRVLFGVPIHESRVPPWPLFQAAAAIGLPALAVLVFCTEGDNVPEAVEMAQKAEDLLHVLPEAGQEAPQRPGADGRWQMPGSWKTILYGSVDVDAAACY